MARPLKATNPKAPHGVLEEHCSSPALLLALAGQAAMRGLRDALTAENIKPRQFQLLGLLHDEGPLAQREVGARLDIDPSILVTHLNPLEEEGLVSRVRDPADRRRHRVCLTEAGRTVFDRALQAQRAAEDALLSALDGDERKQFGRLLLVIRDSGTARHDADCS
jgi:DNA-binding MarR family transcriptional regulator